MNDYLKKALESLARHATGALGAVLGKVGFDAASAGQILEGVSTLIVGGGMLLAAVVWSIVEKQFNLKKAASATSTTPTSTPTA